MPGNPVIRVDYRLQLPTFGFEITAKALLSLEVVEQSADRDGLLIAVGRDAIGRALGALMGKPLPVAPIPIPLPAPGSISSARYGAFDDPISSNDPPPLALSPFDREVLRGYRISPE